MTTILGSKYCQAFLCTDIIITFKLSIRVRAGAEKSILCFDCFIPHGGHFLPSMACKVPVMYIIALYFVINIVRLKVHKIENFFDSDFGICVFSLLVMHK
jgi:hypothetical protein